MHCTAANQYTLIKQRLQKKILLVETIAKNFVALSIFKNAVIVKRALDNTCAV
jgi:hypothetical protein